MHVEGPHGVCASYSCAQASKRDRVDGRRAWVRWAVIGDRYTCNNTGMHNVTHANQFGIVVYDWSNAKVQYE